MNVRFLPHIAVQVGNYTAAVEFLSEFLGMELIERGKQESQLRLGDVTFYVEDNDAGKVFFAFEVDSLSEMRTRLEGAGCRVTSENKEGVMFADPFGLNYFISEAKSR